MEFTDNIKVIYICVSGAGGSNQALLSTLNQLVTKGIIPLVIVPDEETSKLYRSYNYETRIIYMRQEITPRCNSMQSFLLFPLIYIFNYIVNIIAYFRLKKVCKLYNPDIIHSNITVTTLGYKLAKKYNIPHIWHIREYVKHPMLGINLLRKLLNEDNTILVTKGLQEFYNIDNSNARVIYDGVKNNIKPIKSTEIFPNKYFVCVGRLTRGKGIDLLMDSFISFAEKCININLLLIGEGKTEYTNQIKEKLVHHNLLDRVNFVGTKSHDETMLYMRNAEALIVPSLSEGFGLITAEAMFNKCLVIGNNNTGTKEQFDNGIEMTGQEIGIRFNNSNELTNAMLNIAFNGKSYYNHMINNAFDTVNKLYTESNNGTAIYNYYKRLIRVRNE